MPDPVENTETQVEEKVEDKVEEGTQTEGQTESNSEDKKPEDDNKTEDKKPEDKEPKKNHDQRRWERTLKERAEFKAKAEYLEALLAQQKQAAAQNPKEGRPSRDKFESDEDYVDALTDWKLEQKLGNVKQELSQHQAKSQTQVEWASKINQARQDYPDYDTVMEDAQDIPIEPAVADAIQSSDLGGDIAYYLAKNPEEAIRINSLTPMAAAREIGRIESYVEYEKSQKSKKPPVSKAPAPIKPVKSSGTATKSLEDMTPAEYMAFRNKQEAARKGRR